MDEEGALLLRRLERERQARKQAEKFIEERSRELYLKDQELTRKNQELTNVERDLRRERDFITGVIDTAQAVVLVVGEDHRIVRANAFAAKMSGIAAPDLVGVDAVATFFATEAREAAREVLRTARSQVHGEAGTLPLDTTTGERREFGWYHSLLADPGSDVPLLLLVGRDMTERERLFREVERLSTTDPLTGLSNRRHFDAAAQLEILRARRHHRPLSAVMLDVDHFKLVNDTHGHAAGDRVLVALAGLCVAMSRRTDLKARLGGEEFCLLLPETSAASAHQVAERIRTGLQALPFEEAGRSFRVTVSMGVAGYADEESVDALMARADRALYQAKDSGRNRVVVAGDPQFETTPPATAPAPSSPAAPSRPW
jgi:diguanylate cyclase (GGDEF)-like protein/PAS domain S-box-containing protein